MRFLLLLALVLFPASAQADYFKWEHSDTGLTMTYPDTWQKQNNKGPNDILTITAPSNGDNPTCTIQARDDKRYVIFPPEYGDAVQRDSVSIPFWKAYYADYDDYTIDKVYDGGGLGRWHASYAIGSYNVREGTARQARRAMMFASLYYDTLYVVECSTLNHAYERWAPDFRSVIKSIDFKKMYHERLIGEYHDFLKGADKYFWAQTGPEGTTKY